MLRAEKMNSRFVAQNLKKGNKHEEPRKRWKLVFSYAVAVLHSEL